MSAPVEAAGASAFRCSDAARARHDPMLGTAPPARRWLLVEQPRSWAPRAFEGMALDDAVRQVVLAAAEATGARILLVRRHGRSGQDSQALRPLQWIVVDPAAAVPIERGTWESDADLRCAATALRRAAATGRADPSVDDPGHRPAQIVLVCAHGRHDVCCAVRGRPVARELSQHWPDEVWECSHVGGDRFAPNVISLPDGVMFGGLDADQAVNVLSSHTQGRTEPAVVRGVCGHPPLVQAALVAAHRAVTPAWWWRATASRSEGPDAQGRWRVQVEIADTRVEVTGHEQRQEPHRMTCSVGSRLQATVHVVDDVHLLG